MVETATDSSRMDKVVDNVWAKAVARFLVPALLTIVGYFVTTTLADLKEAVKSFDPKIESVRQTFWAAQQGVVKSQNDMNIQLGVLGEKVDQQGNRLDRLEQAAQNGAFAPPLLRTTPSHR